MAANTCRRHGQSERIVALGAIVAFLTVAAVAPASAGKHSDRSSGKSEQFHWSGRIQTGQSLEVNGVNGSIRAQIASGDEVVVDAVKSAHHSDPAEVEIKVVQDSDGITVCAVYPGKGNVCDRGDGWHSHTHNNDVKVDFVVRVPAGVRFSGNTVNGSVQASHLSGDVKAHSVNGSIDISTSGYAEGSTINGSVSAAIGSAHWKEPLEFSTVNGDITLDLPDGVNADVSGETVNGHIESDFPITVHGKFGARRISGTLGQGGPMLTLRSVNGSIRLHRPS